MPVAPKARSHVPCQAAGTVSAGETRPDGTGQFFRYDLGSTLELHCPQCKHKVLLRLSHHCRVCLTRGGQGHQQLRRKTAVWKLPSVETEAGVLRGRRSWLKAQQATQRIVSSSPSYLECPKRWVASKMNCVISFRDPLTSLHA